MDSDAGGSDANPVGWPASVWSAVSNYDWLAIPGAVRAVAQLVGTAGQTVSAGFLIGKAKADQARQGIEDVTAARKAISQAVAKQAAKSAAANPEIVDRHLAAWAGERVRTQANKDAIAAKTVALISEDLPPSDTAGPDDDWLNVFEAHAGKASSERLRDTWARVLAGEIRQPGSFSLSSIQFLSLLDSRLAEMTKEVLKWKCRYNLIYTGERFASSDAMLSLATIGGYGLLLEQRVSHVPFNDDGVIVMDFKSRAIVLSGSPANKVNLNTAVLTRPGIEIAELIDEEPSNEDVHALALHLKKTFLSIVKQVRVGRIASREDDIVKLTELIPV